MPIDSTCVADAACFPVDLHVPNRAFGFLDIDIGVLDRSAFLDNRIEAPLGEARPVPLEAIAAPAHARPGWLFHTSFCCSTLLARALHVAPRQVVLKEPLVLRRLGDARRAGWPVEDFLAPATALLARPWTRQGTVVIKPTHAALNIGVELLHATPGSRAVILTSSLTDFLVSNIKKTPQTQAKIPELAERALSACGFGRRLPAQALAPPDLLSAAVLQWAAQRELCFAMVDSAGPARVRFLDADELLADVPETAVRCSRWLGTHVEEESVRRRARCVASANAKATQMPYSATQRAEDAARIAARHRNHLDAALAWAERWVLPHMQPAARDVPADWSVGDGDPNRMVA